MAGSQRGQAIPTQLGLGQFEQFVLPHLSVGSRGPAPKLSLHKIFNYILHLLYLGCQWKELPIDKDSEGRPEIHHTRIYSAWRRWEADGCIDAIFTGSVMQLHQDELLRAQEAERRQGRRVLRPALQRGRAVRVRAGQPQ